ncbi:hypothetical protein KC331_g32 [Hortaea werneckii]|nr:hypothetical protein KC331_g32 [Hortaea werneckii]
MSFKPITLLFRRASSRFEMPTNDFSSRCHIDCLQETKLEINSFGKDAGMEGVDNKTFFAIDLVDMNRSRLSHGSREMRYERTRPRVNAALAHKYYARG